MLGPRLSHSLQINLWVSRLPAMEKEPTTYPLTSGPEDQAGGIPMSRLYAPCAKVTSGRQRGTLCKSSGQNITNQPTLRVGYKAPHKCASLASAPPNPTVFSRLCHCAVYALFHKHAPELLAPLLSHMLFLCEEGLFPPSPPVEILSTLKTSALFSSCVLVILGCQKIIP